MTREVLNRMERFIQEAQGNVGHVKRVLHISRLLAERESLSYHEGVLAFASYFHDISAYAPYAPPGPFDHAMESAKLMPDMARQWGYAGQEIEMIVEAVEYHDKPGLGHHVETRLIRNADGIDYLGYMAVARDFMKQQKDMNKALETLKRRKAMFTPLIDLPAAQELAQPRIAELDQFILRFEEESFGIY